MKDSVHDIDEQLMGFSSVLEDKVEVPFTPEVLGLKVTVSGVRQQVGSIVAICSHGEHRQTIDVLDLPLPSSAPCGAEWVATHRSWADRR